MVPHQPGAQTSRAETGRSPERNPWLKAYPPDVDWFAQLEAKPAQSLLEDTAKKYASRTCCYFLGKTFSYATIDRLANRLAAGLQKFGVGKGVNVGLLMPNTPALIIFYYGILKAGGTVVNFNPLFNQEELTYQARDARLHAMATLDLETLYPKVDRLLREAVIPSAIVSPFARCLTVGKAALFKRKRKKGIADWRTSEHADKIISYNALIQNGERPEPVAIDPANDLAVVQYTCGTTAAPKGAMLTHANVSINTQQTLLWARNSTERHGSTLGILPFVHIFGMTGVMNAAIAGGATILLLPRPDVNQAIKLIRQMKPNVISGLPMLFNALMNSPELRTDDLASVRICISGGAALPRELKRSFEELAGRKIIEGYGLSETSPIVAGNPISDNDKVGSIGLPLPATRISIRSLEDPNKEVPLGEDGEICVAGPQVMKGYWQRPKETADVMVGEFLRTGDVGYMDAQGYTFVIDRIKDIIQCSGFNVYPRNIEEAIYQFPGVDEVTVIGIADDLRTQAPKAFIKLKSGTTATEDEIFEFLKPKLNRIQMPSQIEFRDTLPKILVGKPSKKQLRAEIKGDG